MESSPPWQGKPETIEYMFPAIAALIKIGPPAASVLIDAAQGPLTPLDRRATVFAISRMTGVHAARAFLSSGAAEAELESMWAEQGLQRLDSRK